MKTFFVGLNLKSRFPKPAVGKFVRSSEHDGYYIWRREVTEDIARLAELVNEASEFLQKNGNPHFLLMVLPFGEDPIEELDDETLFKQGVELALSQQSLPEDAHEKVVEGYHTEIQRQEEVEEQRLAEIEAQKAKLEAERKAAAEKEQAEAEQREKEDNEARAAQEFEAGAALAREGKELPFGVSESAKAGYESVSKGPNAGDKEVENPVINPTVDVSSTISQASQTEAPEPTTTEQSGSSSTTAVPEAKKGKLKTKAEKAAERAAEKAAAKEANGNQTN